MKQQQPDEASGKRQGETMPGATSDDAASNLNTSAVDDIDESLTKPDWRIWLGLGITVLWLLLLSIYIASTIGWMNIGTAPIERLGNFLEGAFAPLAFLWLVIGYFLQRKELTQNTAAIRMQHVEIQKSAEQAVMQTQALIASEQHVRKQSFLQTADVVRRQLGGISGFLFLSSQGGGEGGVVSAERIAELWSAINNTDPEGFTRSLLQLRFIKSERYAYKLLYGTEIRTRHSSSFIFHLERLLAMAEKCDDDGILRDAMLDTAHGRLYQWMIEARDTPPAGFTYGVYDFDPDSDD